MFKKLFLTIFIFFGVLGAMNVAQGGFGISPPYVRTNKPIFAGSHYEQRITLLRSSADDDLEAIITINAPEIEPWISLDKGDVFDLPKGKFQVPMVVMVDIPPDAEIGNYKGHINIRIAPKDKSRGAGVAIALGARVDIDLEVTDETFVDFIIRKVSIPDMEEFTKPWNWPIFSYFFYKMDVNITLENSGNTEIAPTKVHVDVYDLSEKELLASYDDKSIDKIDPFIQDETTASFRTKLSAGQYWAKIKIYKDKDIVHKDKIIFTVKGAGSTAGGLKMGWQPWAMLSGMILICIFILLLAIKLRSWRILLIFLWPFFFIVKKLLAMLGAIKSKFWRWIYNKSSQHHNNSRK